MDYINTKLVGADEAHDVIQRFDIDFAIEKQGRSALLSYKMEPPRTLRADAPLSKPHRELRLRSTPPFLLCDGGSTSAHCNPA